MKRVNAEKQGGYGRYSSLFGEQENEIKNEQNIQQVENEIRAVIGERIQPAYLVIQGITDHRHRLVHLQVTRFKEIVNGLDVKVLNVTVIKNVCIVIPLDKTVF
jgi:hypothetical protein